MLFCDNEEMSRLKYRYLNNTKMMANRLIEMTSQEYFKLNFEYLLA